MRRQDFMQTAARFTDDFQLCTEIGAIFIRFQIEPDKQHCLPRVTELHRIGDGNNLKDLPKEKCAMRLRTAPFEIPRVVR